MSNPELVMAIDEHAVIHWMWLYGTTLGGYSIDVSLCSHIGSIISVKKSNSTHLTCLRCLDIESQFW